MELELPGGVVIPYTTMLYLHPSPLLLLVTCCFHRFVFSRGGPDRTFDLTYNKLYGQFPRFLVSQAADLSDSCLCATNFTVSAGNQLYCPTKASLEGVNVTPNLLETFKQANYTCLLPKQKEPVSVAGAGMSRACIEDTGVLLSSRGRVCMKGQRVGCVGVQAAVRGLTSSCSQFPGWDDTLCSSVSCLLWCSYGCRQFDDLYTLVE